MHGYIFKSIDKVSGASSFVSIIFELGHINVWLGFWTVDSLFFSSYRTFHAAVIFKE